MSEKQVGKILLNSMPRSGSTFMRDFLSEAFQFAVVEPSFTGGLTRTLPQWDPYEVDESYKTLKTNELLHSHYRLSPDLKRWIEADDVLTVFLYRDPRDAAVSAVLFIKYFLKHHILHKYFSSVSDAEAIEFFIRGGVLAEEQLTFVVPGQEPFLEYDGIRYLCAITEEWRTLPNVIPISYESLFPNPERYLTTLFREREIAFDEARLRSVAERMTFASASGGRKQGEEDKGSHLRKGIVGDYKNHLPPALQVLTDALIGETLEVLGYDTSPVSSESHLESRTLLRKEVLSQLEAKKSWLRERARLLQGGIEASGLSEQGKLAAELIEARNWGKECALKIEERDKEIHRLQAALAEVTDWAKTSSEGLLTRDKEIVRLQSILEGRVHTPS